MRTNLLETYSKQIAVAEAYVSKNFDGKQISDRTKLATAVLLDNTNRYMTESIATSRADLGDWKKFCLNLTNLAVPSLIANNLVIVHPMTSYSGSVAYLKYVSKTNKGGIKVDDEFNGVFGLGDMNESRRNFTSQVIVETVGSTKKVGLTPAAIERFKDDNGNAAIAKVVSGNTVTYIAKADIAKLTSGTDLAENDKVYYFSTDFQMEEVPATDIPTIGPKLEHIALVAEPRRIAVKYDQISAFQAKTDYGFSLDKQIAEQACGELAYEIDSEIVNMLYEACDNTDKLADWSKTPEIGVSRFEHYNAFLEVFEKAKTIIYKRTKKFHPNYMVCASDCLEVLRFVNGFTYIKAAKMNGPYKVGELDGVEIYVSPDLGEGEFFLGLNGNDMMSSAGVYAPYMAIVPTQLLGTPDGGLMQGFSTWYAKAILNANLLVKGKIVA